MFYLYELNTLARIVILQGIRPAFYWLELVFCEVSSQTMTRIGILRGILTDQYLYIHAV